MPLVILISRRSQLCVAAKNHRITALVPTDGSALYYPTSRPAQQSYLVTAMHKLPPSAQLWSHGRLPTSGSRVSAKHTAPGFNILCSQGRSLPNETFIFTHSYSLSLTLNL